MAAGSKGKAKAASTASTTSSTTNMTNESSGTDHNDSTDTTTPTTGRIPFFSQPFSVQWRKALVSAPRLVPLGVLRYTSAEGPHPFIVNLPSRGKYLIPCYVFVPTAIEAEKDANGLPVIIDFHGGGFVLGSCLEQGPFCAKMARDLGAVVICVDYRMGPIDKFPAAIEDGEDVLRAVLDETAPGGPELRAAIAKRLTKDERKQIRRARKQAKRDAKRDVKELRRQAKHDGKAAKADRGRSRGNSGTSDVSNTSLPDAGGPGDANGTSSANLTVAGGNLRPNLLRRITPKMALSRTTSKTNLSRTSTSTSLASLGDDKPLANVKTPTSFPGSFPLSRAPTGASALTGPNTANASSTSLASSIDSLADAPVPVIDPTRIAMSGFSSGGNLILNLALSIPASPPLVQRDWPSPIPADFPTPIPLLLYYPSFDCRQLPSERPKPKGLVEGGGFWSEANDLLMPTYLPRDQAAHPRASPGLAQLKYGVQGQADAPAGKHYGLHAQARMHLVLPELDSLSEQSEVWVQRVHDQGRDEHLVVNRFPGMKHGWTQMPESWLGADERVSRLEAFAQSVAFVRQFWESETTRRQSMAVLRAAVAGGVPRVAVGDFDAERAAGSPGGSPGSVGSRASLDSQSSLGSVGEDGEPEAAPAAPAAA